MRDPPPSEAEPAGAGVSKEREDQGEPCGYQLKGTTWALVGVGGAQEASGGVLQTRGAWCHGGIIARSGARAEQLWPEGAMQGGPQV